MADRPILFSAPMVRAQLAHAYDLLTKACGDIAAICTMHKAEAKTPQYTAPYVAAINAHDRKDAPHG
jgi:hypothetical protein